MTELDINDVRSVFDWVVDEFGFTFAGVDTSLGTIFRYETPTIYLNVGRWKGELDVWFSVPNQENLPPEKQWTITVDDIVRHLGGKRGLSTSYQSTREQIHRALSSQSECIRQYATSLLRGNTELLEEIIQTKRSHA